jgi:DNA-damage-inducible protein J
MDKSRGDIMAQTALCIRIDTKLKKDFDMFCDSIGMSMSTAVNVFIKKAIREQRIPFDITASRDAEKK